VVTFWTEFSFVIVRCIHYKRFASSLVNLWKANADLLLLQERRLANFLSGSCFEELFKLASELLTVKSVKSVRFIILKTHMKITFDCFSYIYCSFPKIYNRIPSLNIKQFLFCSKCFCWYCNFNCFECLLRKRARWG